VKQKHKTKRDFYRVDFVTTYSVEECRAILQRETARMAPDWQRIFLHDDNSFIIERLVTLPVLMQVRSESAVEVCFKGTLEAIENGTRVRGAVSPDSYENYRYLYITAAIVLVIAIIIGVVLIITLEAWPVFVAIALVMFPLWAFLTWRWREIRWYPLELTNWVRTQLSTRE
jgi:hypothetical protein